MNLVHHWCITIILALLAVGSYTAAVRRPLNGDQPSQRPSRYISRFVKPDEEAQKLAMTVQTEPEALSERDHSLWDHVIASRTMAEESLARVKNEILDTDAEDPLLTIRISQGEKRGKPRRRIKRSNGAGDSPNDEQPPASADATDKTPTEETVGAADQPKPEPGKRAKQPKRRHRSVTAEEVKLVLSPAEQTEYARLKKGVSKWRSKRAQVNAAKRFGIAPTKRDVEALRVGQELNNKLDRMKYEIQKRVVKMGKARPDVMKRLEQKHQYRKKYQRTRAQTDRARMKVLKARKDRHGLMPDEQAELDALQAARDRINEGQRTRRAAKKAARPQNDRKTRYKAAPAEGVAEPSASGDGAALSEVPQADNTSEMSADQQQSGFVPEDSPADNRLDTAQMHPPAGVDRQPNNNQRQTNPLMRFGTSLMESISRVNDRLHTSPGVPHAPSFGPPLAPILPAPGVVF
ncbi:MAG: hypothetical protein M1816_003200 [Peltula sp. TS41687]|nr:MAG: hypothetical protein M1816_003200 [Peltula sp. TS41687]